MISETGLPISAGSPSSSGSTPAYAAFPLFGGEHLPAGVPTVTAGPQAGETAVGPLDLTPVIQATLNADLDASKMAIVQTPSQSYAVEYLPRYGLSQAEAASSASAADSGQATPASTTGSSASSSLSAFENNLTIQGIPATELAKWVKTGTNGLLQWTSSGLSDLEKALDPSSDKKTATKAGTNVEAQYLSPPLAESSPSPLPVPMPEPSSWLVFGVILGGAGLRQWVGKAR